MSLRNLLITALLCHAIFSASSADVIQLDFSPSPLAPFEKELDAIRQTNGIEMPTLAPNEIVAVRFQRSEARPQDRWLDGTVEFRADAGSLERLRVEAAVFAIGGAQPVARVSAAPTKTRGTLHVDLRSAALPRARVVVTLAADGKTLGVAETFISAQSAPAIAPGQRIAIQLDVPRAVEGKRPLAMNFDVPFAAGSLWSTDALRLVDSQGRELPCQKEVTGLWARDGAIQWVRFDTVAAPADGIFVEHGRPASAKPASAVTVEEKDGRIVVNTGAAAYTLASGASPVTEIRVDGRVTTRSAGAKGLYVVDQNGRVASAAAQGETVEIEARGPVAACVRFEGDYRTADGVRLARHITRLEFFAGQSEARIQHTLVLTEDSNQIWFKDIGWELAADAGAGPQAWFATSREDGTKCVWAPLSGAAPCAWLLQDKHFMFAEGTNHFAVATAAGTLCEGGECGDWFALAGASGGLGWSCRDAARQHPKEFEARPDRVTLHLWSSRGGEELDFHMPVLLKKWNAADWWRHVLPQRDLPKIPQFYEQALKIKHNAVGWAKTHSLLLRPLAAGEKIEAMVQASARHSQPVYALADPQWTYASRAMGPLHPRDAKKFPEVEAALDGTAALWHARIHAFGEYGFVDYYAGPHLEYTGIYPNAYRYHCATYALRPGLWLLYARSGDRATRELAATNNQSFMDKTLTHWDGPGKKRGLFLAGSEGGDEPATPATLPLYWQARSGWSISCSTDLNQFIRDFHLTGNRRARDVVRQFAAAAKRHWSPGEMHTEWRVIMAYRCLAQAGSVDWDPHVCALADATLDILSDDAGAVGLTKNRPYHSSTYKTQADVEALLDGWELLGTPRAHDVALKVARFLALGYFTTTPMSYENPAGRIGNFLYAETGDASIPESLAMQLRWLGRLWDREKNEFRERFDASQMLFIVEGAAYAQDLLRRCDGWDKPAAAWAGADDFGSPVSFVVQKPDRAALKLRLASPDNPAQLGEAGGGVKVHVLNPPSGWGLDLNRITEGSTGSSLIEIPLDAPAAAYEITPGCTGRHILFADALVPLVLHAPGYWQPAPQDPPLRWFFRVPQGASDAQIFFEGQTRLFDPAGAAFGDGKPVRGWINLPGDRAGLWSFEPIETKLVRVRNLPPFFAQRDAKLYFDPPIAWQFEPPVQITKADPKQLYVPGVIATKGNQALHLTGRRVLTIEAGPARADGDGGTFLPFKQGTIEFFYKPNWSTFDPDKSGNLLSLDTGGDAWGLSTIHHPEGEQWFSTHSLLAMFLTDGASKRRSIRCYRQTLLEAGRWVHVAWTWGVRQDIALRASEGLKKRAAAGVLVQQVYIDGQPGKFSPDPIPGNLPALAPLRLRTGPAFDGAIDELRISDVMRYPASFAPPAADREFTLDEHTRALFHFNGTLVGDTAAGPGTVTAIVKTAKQ